MEHKVSAMDTALEQQQRIGEEVIITKKIADHANRAGVIIVPTSVV
jgi:hypothetical protein